MPESPAEPHTESSASQRRSIVPVNEERPFELHELFFSTTDSKGLIQTGNDVFVRVSGYSIEELVGKPHNIIRHPEMPRCVFKLLWDYIQSGKSIAAYVKNMAKDGRYYWVVASVSPIPGGYLSVRCKPCTPLKGLVEAVYAQLLALEKEIENRPGGSVKQAMEASAEKLREILKGQGYAGYGDFMRAMLAEELKARDSHVAKCTPKTEAEVARARASSQLPALLRACRQCEDWLGQVFSVMDSLHVLNGELHSKSEFVSDLAQNTRLLSLNALIEASRLKDLGAAVSIVAENMAGKSNEIISVIERLNGHIDEIFPISGKVMSDVSAAKLKIEMATFFTKEMLFKNAEDSSGEFVQNLDMLMIKGFGGESLQIMKMVESLCSLLGRLENSVVLLKDVVRALEFIHISGRVEASRSEDFSAFGIIFDQVIEQVTQAKKQLDDFLGMIAQIRVKLGEMQASEKLLRELMSDVAAQLSALG